MESKTDIITKAIQKAIDGGWVWQDFQGRGYFPVYLKGEAIAKHIAETMLDMRLYSLIFNHDFAKALWGEDEEYARMGGEYDPAINYGAGWQYHLQQMVIAEDPLKYLGEHLDA